jgi:hypothetical protein
VDMNIQKERKCRADERHTKNLIKQASHIIRIVNPQAGKLKGRIRKVQARIWGIPNLF